MALSARGRTSAADIVIVMIVAMDEHRLIGKQGKLPWHCKADLEHFHALTKGQQLLIGRKTFDHLPPSMHHEHMYVATHRALPYNDRWVACTDVKKLLREWKQKEASLYVCGGAQIYKQAFPYVDEIWLSCIEGCYEGDTFLPAFDVSCFQMCDKKQYPGFVLYHYHHRMEKKG